MAAPDIVYLVSTAGHPNYGDELIARGWLAYLAARRPHADVWLDCPEPGRAAVLLAGAHPRLHVTDTMWRVALSHDSEDRGAAHAAVRHRVSHLGTPREDLGLQLAARARSVHLLGGGHLVAAWPANLLLTSLASQMAREHDVPVVMTGVGLVPMGDADTELVRAALADFAYADARDPLSAQRFGIPVRPDDAFLALGQGAVVLDRRPAPRGMVLLQGDLHDRARMTQALDASLDVMRAEGLEGQEIGVVEAIPPEDSWLLDAVRERWPSVRFYPFGEVWTEGLPVGPDQVWVTSRFHIHLVAAAVGARGIAVNTGLEYYRVKHESLLRLGTGWALAEAGAPWPSATVDPTFPQRALRASEERRQVADTLYPHQDPTARGR
ncbi:polysaccharide pyruvyl transferase family protein [Phycicoccus endophyticus]|uniref:Polysaccharide pyruvyl transferase family protein n=1 Tax=Phycicoccus endophyticus TaxID=1690220 RepID=A0A7G9R3P6_9MICO|nr:polysaccharide pyruvyl transferase family protein [Phycicoccus endophyticus]NHI18042.1 polysaccharide pyruvyl transferase family protein [Phycicoccus endophyticus]QNN50221.1 polysaccharide pyruvyl transferase family protein [Phycicoccus endophyticus]GGL26895.1 hypothetical protein GCM10012283_06390 [Phycicoccus endophyticus]